MRGRHLLAPSLVLALLLAAAPARAGVFWVAELAGARLTGRLDPASGRAELAVDGEPALEAAPIAPDVRLEPWSRGPRVAGWASRYLVGSCGGVSPGVLAAGGFPLAVGDGRRYLFATRDLRFGVPFRRDAAARSEGE